MIKQTHLLSQVPLPFCPRSRSNVDFDEFFSKLGCISSISSSPQSSSTGYPISQLPDTSLSLNLVFIHQLLSTLDLRPTAYRFCLDLRYSPVILALIKIASAGIPLIYHLVV